MSNLLSNALKFTTKGHIDFYYQKKDDKTLMFCVQDTGIGIPKDRLKNIFYRYEQVVVSNSPETGTGLGLAIAENLVRRMGGEMWIESEVGVGSQFFFTLPYRPVDQHEKKKTPDTYEYDFSNETVLIVEDDEYNFRFLENTLKLVNATILWVKDGQDAVNRVSVDKHIDLVLMDIGLPKMDGFVATRKILQINPCLPVIAQTAYSLAEDEKKCYASGCIDYLNKPVNPVQLLQKMQQAINDIKRTKNPNKRCQKK